MTKVDPPASDLKVFDDIGSADFPQRFDAWKAEVESLRNGTLAIGAEEMLNGDRMFVFWSILPNA